MGLRFRLHRRDLPSTPDLVLPKRRAVVMVHGCFWHQDSGCRLASQLKTRLDYWLPNLACNQERDVQARARLEALGWQVHVIWKCETRDEALVAAQMRGLLKPK